MSTILLFLGAGLVLCLVVLGVAAFGIDRANKEIYKDRDQ